MSDAARARVVVATPFLNPTVEIEMRRLLPPDVDYLVTRLASQAAAPEQRLVDYLEQLPRQARELRPLAADAWLFACTGSSYLVAEARARALLAETAEILGAPVFTACDSLEWWLARAGRRLRLLVPYPDWLAKPAFAYWQGRGFELVATRQLKLATGDDTRGIYALADDAAASAVRSLLAEPADALVISGTGMPSLQLVSHLREEGHCAISSNIALAERLLRELGLAPQ